MFAAAAAEWELHPLPAPHRATSMAPQQQQQQQSRGAGRVSHSASAPKAAADTATAAATANIDALNVFGCLLRIQLSPHQYQGQSRNNQPQQVLYLCHDGSMGEVCLTSADELMRAQKAQQHLHRATVGLGGGGAIVSADWDVFPEEIALQLKPGFVPEFGDAGAGVSGGYLQ